MIRERAAIPVILVDIMLSAIHADAFDLSQCLDLSCDTDRSRVCSLEGKSERE